VPASPTSITIACLIFTPKISARFDEKEEYPHSSLTPRRLSEERYFVRHCKEEREAVSLNQHQLKKTQSLPFNDKYPRQLITEKKQFYIGKCYFDRRYRYDSVEMGESEEQIFI
jgi:hypothetical protein